MTLIWAVILLLSIMAIFLFCVIPTKSVGVIDAEKARLVQKEHLDRKKLYKLLKPVFKKVVRAADDGLSETQISKIVWNIEDEVVHQQALLELERLGYKVVKHYSYEAGGYYIVVSW